jgi:two-component system CheB/CheR fusion protein
MSDQSHLPPHGSPSAPASSHASKPVDASAARDPAVQKSELTFPVVGIGASAGGIAALKTLLAPMQADIGMAFVVAVHLSPTHESSMASILQRSTVMPVLEVTEPVALQANHVYVISPSMQLLMTDGMLRVSPLDRRSGPHTAIDLMFRSLAQAHGKRAVCIVLSGTGADGAQGLGPVKEAGGVTIAQQPDDAQYGDMPRSAIATGLVDIVLPAADLALRLLALWHDAQRLELPEPPPSLSALVEPSPRLDAEQALRGVILLLRDRTGVDFAHYKPATVLRRLERRMKINGRTNLPAYRDLLESTPAETAPLLQDMLISVTRFFRDPQAFEALEAELLARPFDLVGTPPTLRAWVAGCATGEEAYSVAIVLGEVLAASSQAALQIFASDLDQRAIDVARRGHYPGSIDLDVTPRRLQEHFEREAHGFQVRKSVRESILFAVHNVLRDPPFTRVDLICCRNLLIYLDRQAQAEVLRAFHFALHPGGLLFLGNSESIDAVADLFTPVDLKQRLYRANRLEDTKPYFGPAGVALDAPIGAPRAVVSSRVAAASPASPHQPLELLHARAVARAGPPSVLLDADHQMLHVSERAARFFRFVGGVPSSRVLEVVRPELRVELRTALFRAVESGRVVASRRVRLAAADGLSDVAMSVHPLTDDSARGLLLVVFDAHETSSDTVGPPDPRHPSAAPGGDVVTAALEDELMHAKETLRQVVFDAVASTEELRAANEELQSMNEELRSATEELEASREELQSVNEELTDVNAEQRRKVEETGRVNDDLTNLIASTEIGTVFIDRSLCVKRYTPQATQIFNLIPSDVGRPLLHITHKLRYDELEQDAMAVLRSLTTVERELCTQDDRVFLARLLPYRTAEDRIDGVVLNFFDITARSQAEAKVRLSEQHMRMVAGSMHDYAFVTFDVDGLITTWNGGAEGMFGHRAVEVIGRSVDVIFTEADRQAGVLQHEMRLARERGKADDDRWLARKDGSVFFASGVMTALTANGLQGYAKIARDMTSNKMIEVRREAVLVEEQAQRSRVEEASALKDEFLAVMSHELKNPLNLIQLNAELLLRTPQAREIAVVVRAAGTIRQAVVSQAQIIDDLLDLSRLDTGKLALAPAPLDMGEVIQRTVAAIAMDASAKQQSIQLDLQPDVMAFADPVRVEQIVWNLLANALKFTPPGGRIMLSLSSDAGMVCVAVTDTGIGLAPHEVETVFEMFHQVDSGTNRDKGGLGIGLALVKRIAVLHGGRVEARSPGLSLGSTFSVWLPSDPAPPRRAASPAPMQPSDLQGLRILMVDDEPATLFAFSELLAMEGATVSMAASAAEGLQLLQSRSFDVLVSDLAMPGMDGYEFIALVRKQLAGLGMPSIAVSGMGRQHDIRRAVEAGFDAHLSKPLQLAQLTAEIIRLRQLRAATTPPP